MSRQRLHMNADGVANLNQASVIFGDLYEDTYRIGLHDYKDRVSLASAGRGRLNEMPDINASLGHHPFEGGPDGGVIKQSPGLVSIRFGNFQVGEGRGDVRLCLVAPGLAFEVQGFRG